MDVDEKQIDKYMAALQLLFYEGEIAWQMNLLFIGLNVGIGTIIGDSLKCIHGNTLLLSIFSIFGLIINISWLGTFRRNNKYYHFRMAQARNSEPKSWKLLRKRGYKFSKGIEIVFEKKGLDLKDTTHKLMRFERMASNKRAIEIAIWIFIIGFITLLTTCLYYFTSSCK